MEKKFQDNSSRKKLLVALLLCPFCQAVHCEKQICYCLTKGSIRLSQVDRGTECTSIHCHQQV